MRKVSTESRSCPPKFYNLVVNHIIYGRAVALSHLDLRSSSTNLSQGRLAFFDVKSASQTGDFLIGRKAV